mmetsp:Transcript_22916/g.22219  ORF Transcript_22916/g.22219 Transcript_22916/m.22219 type:complete len:102 (+) Transcript_22916:333-638(+)
MILVHSPQGRSQLSDLRACIHVLVKHVLEISLKVLYPVLIFSIIKVILFPFYLLPRPQLFGNVKDLLQGSFLLEIKQNTLSFLQIDVFHFDPLNRIVLNDL